MPARFDFFKMQLFYLKYILNQEEKSMIFQFLKLQLENPTKCDWMDMDTLQKVDTWLVKKKFEESAFSYLLKKHGSKDSEIEYTKLEMASYLLPNN